MRPKLNIRFDSKKSDISDIFNKIEEELSKLYESSMVSLSSKSSVVDDSRKSKPKSKKSYFKNYWLSMLNLH